MIGFLRRNTRHHFYWRKGCGLPKLNPISSTHGGGVRTISLYEPLSVYRLRKRLFAFGDHQRCGRRGGMPDFDGKGSQAKPDTWGYGPDGNRTCSYCGSIHPDDLMKICRLALKDERYSIDGTTKSYKVYVRQPGVQNASEGAIKFYMHHAPAEPSAEDQALFSEAVRVSSERFRKRMESWRAEREATAADRG
jgi:hypothetical protein